jgi:hypothetical protein
MTMTTKQLYATPSRALFDKAHFQATRVNAVVYIYRINGAAFSPDNGWMFTTVRQPNRRIEFRIHPRAVGGAR